MREANSENFNFYYGTMGSAKSAQLLTRFYNCKFDNGMNVSLFKPYSDNRYEGDFIASRAGLKAKAIVLDTKTNIFDLVLSYETLPHIIMVDEIQFFLPEQIEQLKALADYYQVAVDVYGLKNNFRNKLFGEETGTIKRVLELATNIIQINSYCACGNTATDVARFNPETWEIQKEGEEILIGGNNKYVPLCYKCWSNDFIPRTARVRILEDFIRNEKTKKRMNLIKISELEAKLAYETEMITIEKDSLQDKQRLEIQAKIKRLTSN